MIDFKLEAEKICNCVEDIARGKLNSKEDLQRITELALQNNKMELLEELTFQAKYSQGLVKIIQNRDNKIEDDYFIKIQAEMVQSLSKVKKLLDELLQSAGDFLKTIYKEKYFEMTQQSLFNLNNLCNDLGYLKLYFNDLKRDHSAQ